MNSPLVLESRKREEPWPTGYEVDARTFYPDWQGLQDVVSKIPQEWVLKPNKKSAQPGRKEKPGVRWIDPNNDGNRVRVDRGDPDHTNTTQQIDHVFVGYGGAVRGRDGKPIEGRVKGNEDAHIPLTEYLNWKTWYAP